MTIRQAESGTPIGDLYRQLGVSEAPFYTWKKKYAHLGVSELRRLRQVEEENSRLKGLVADLSLDKHMLSEVRDNRSSKKSSALVKNRLRKESTLSPRSAWFRVVR